MNLQKGISAAFWGLLVVIISTGCDNEPKVKPAYPLPIDEGEVQQIEIITFPGPDSTETVQVGRLISTMHQSTVVHDLNRAKPVGLLSFKPTHSLIFRLRGDSVRTFHFRGSQFKEKGDFSLEVSIPNYADSLWNINR